MIQKNILKSYAPEARKEFIKAVAERAAFYGITEKKITSSEVKGDFIFISGRPFPKSIEKKRNDLIARVEKAGFDQTMEEIAYTWFNRFMAIRFMEVNGYLSHGYRALSHPQGHNEPELLEKAQFIEKLDGLEKDEILKLKTAAGKESELYRRLIIAQCNDLSAALPFLFERVDDPTELLLPDNLLNTDSVIRRMTSEIPEDNWKEVEIVGWLYQFYISEKKDELMKAKKAYKTEEIPAVTQLFTPNWIVKYLVQNSLGAKWLATYPKSGIKAKMEYYIPSAEQSDEVKAKLKEITPEALNPEELTVMDPACGSGHILVEAYELLKEIYLERGYRARDIAGLILTKNLFGLEIDDRAAQLAGFALVMKAFADDREIFKKGIKPNVICLKSGNGAGSHFKEAQELVDLFENTKTIGSLIRVPKELQSKLPAITKLLEKKKAGDIFEQKDAEVVELLLQQATVLSGRYDCVVANPPYMGGKGMNSILKEFAKTQYSQTKSDLFAMFIERGFEMAKDKTGYNAMVTMQSWMFLSSYEQMRQTMLNTATIRAMVHMSNGVMGIAFGTCATVWHNSKMVAYKGSFSYVDYADLNDENIPREFPLKNNRLKDASSNDFKKIPSSPIAYWVSESVRIVFEKAVCLSEIGTPRQGLATGDNDQFRRNWAEVNYSKVGLCGYENSKKWFPYNSGGEYRKWYGNQFYVVNWEQDGKAIRNCVDEAGSQKSRPQNTGYYFKPSISWAKVTSGGLAMRYFPQGFIFDVAGCSIFTDNEDELMYLLGFFNSCLKEPLIASFCPTINFEVGQIANAPILQNTNRKLKDKIITLVRQCILLSRSDWDNHEHSWNYQGSPLLNKGRKKDVANSYEQYRKDCCQMVESMSSLEQDNNSMLIETYGLQGEVVSGVPLGEITLFANPKHRYKGELSDSEMEARFKADSIKELISYAIGCMMGRYSLDTPGLVYAHDENKGFDQKKYKTFPADEDGIIPITEHEWFDDDAASRFYRFVEVSWDKKGLDENLDFVAEAIGRKSGEPSREVIRRYFVNDFFKDHCQTYKNRPIYWLFSSGKERAFQALVYLHRYNEGTLARMRTEYVLPLQTKIARHIEHLVKDKDTASGAAANKIQKEIVTLQKQQAELAKFDEKLRHYADMKIKIDLDDGVKANYVKFGELLEPIKGLKYGSEED